MDGQGTRTTERLRLEPIGPGQADELFGLYQDPGTARWFGPWTRDDVRDAAAAMGRGWQVDGVHKWLAYDRRSGDLVGRGGLSYADVDGTRRLEIGWAVREALWGLGYAGEIGRAGLSFAFEELYATEVVSFTEPHNRRSRAVMERLGFRYEKEFRRDDDLFVLYVLAAAPGTKPRTSGTASRRLPK